MTAREIMNARAELLKSIAHLIDMALAAGLNKDEIQAVLEQAVEILSESDEA